MDLTAGIEKMSVGQPPEGRGLACQTCKALCSGFQPHSWRKACVVCHCSLLDHAPVSDLEADHRMGRLLADSRYAHLTAKVKGGAGQRVYKRNRMIVTNPVVSRKDPTFNTVTYDWAPPGLTQKLAMQYMELLPEEKRPVAGTPGALHRHRQLLRQLPEYDQDPAACPGLSEPEARAMAAFVRGYKEEALGVGEVALPGDGGVGREAAANQRNGKRRDHAPSDAVAVVNNATSNGMEDGCKKGEYSCSGCGGPAPPDAPVVYAERAGYGRQWHPTCFVCGECEEPLVDLVYFWRGDALLCGRHYGEGERPRCAGCDQLIFSEAHLTGPDGRTWHGQHFCCWRCGRSLDAPCSCPR